jgi:2-amino-4-hydroxy-6-hydroxymethyldihydropteridine diphosphokinase
MTPAYIALGSNLRQPQNQLRKAVIALHGLPRTHIERVSSVYRSAAVGHTEQPDYLNAVALVSTGLSPTDLLHVLQQVENDQGRIRDIRWGPRTLDLDLLLYGNTVVNSPRLTVPHPRMRERHFVLYPLHEISGPDLVLPDGTDIAALLRQCPAHGLTKTRFRLPTNQSAQRGQPKLDPL